jgi:diacylglycerol kinase family enzyme
MEVRLIVNPTASAVSGPRCRAVEAELAAHHRVRVETTRARDDATGLAGRAVADGVDAVVTLGGDGTLNEAANAVVGSEVVLGALPGGSTNVFCRGLGLPDDPVEAARRLDRSLAAGERARIGVGGVRVDGGRTRWFLSHTGVGWDAALVRIVERHARLKRHLGHALFVAAGVRTFAGGFDRARPHLRVDADGQHVPDGYLALALNRDPYTYLGHRPFVVDPAATGADALTIAVLRSLRVRHFAPLLVDALRGQGLRPGPNLQLLRGVRDATVHRLGPMEVQVDGDHLGPAEVVALTHRPDALWISPPAPGVPPPGRS